MGNQLDTNQENEEHEEHVSEVKEEKKLDIDGIPYHISTTLNEFKKITHSFMIVREKNALEYLKEMYCKYSDNISAIKEFIPLPVPVFIGITVVNKFIAYMIDFTEETKHNITKYISFINTQSISSSFDWTCLLLADIRTQLQDINNSSIIDNTKPIIAIFQSYIKNVMKIETQLLAALNGVYQLRNSEVIEEIREAIMIIHNAIKIAKLREMMSDIVSELIEPYQDNDSINRSPSSLKNYTKYSLKLMAQKLAWMTKPNINQRVFLSCFYDSKHSPTIIEYINGLNIDGIKFLDLTKDIQSPFFIYCDKWSSKKYIRPISKRYVTLWNPDLKSGFFGLFDTKTVVKQSHLRADERYLFDWTRSDDEKEGFSLKKSKESGFYYDICYPNVPGIHYASVIIFPIFRYGCIGKYLFGVPGKPKTFLYHKHFGMKTCIATYKGDPKEQGYWNLEPTNGKHCKHIMDFSWTFKEKVQMTIFVATT